MSKKQVFNPYLPLYEYVPDGEPHVFGDRIYVYGSHDRFHGGAFCLNDYVCYSAPLDDLTAWKYEGVIYRADQDPENQKPVSERRPLREGYGLSYFDGSDKKHALWAPDVVCGPDGRYYLYYCLDFLPEIGVAVADSPAGKYEFLGKVRHRDGSLLGDREGDLIQFDPGVFMDDDGTVYLYSGNAAMNKRTPRPVSKGSQVMTLEHDMLTLKTEPRPLLPDLYDAEGTDFEGHGFFEASSIRKIGGRYYLIYSSANSHELCYAVSANPDRNYCYGGTIVDIGDIYLNGRTEEEALNPTGNTHGGIECVKGQWYVFYHRQTDRTNFSRQGCAEKITILPDGSIPQTEVTSYGLNAGPLRAEGSYPASISCRLQGKEGAPFSSEEASDERFPYYTQPVPDFSPDEEASCPVDFPVQYIANLRDGAIVGYKFFEGGFRGKLEFTLRGQGTGRIRIFYVPKRCFEAYNGADQKKPDPNSREAFRELGQTAFSAAEDWSPFESAELSFPEETVALYFIIDGDVRIDLRSFRWNSSMEL